MVEEDSSILASQSKVNSNDDFDFPPTQKEQTDTYKQPSPLSWKMDLTINDISSDIFSQISSQNTPDTTNGETSSSQPISYEQPQNPYHTLP